MDKDKTNSAGKVATMLVLGVILGGAIAYPIGHAMANDSMSSNMTQSSTSTTTKAADLRATLNNALREHVTTNLQVSYNIIDEAPEARMQASLDAQTANAVAIADAVGSVYGDKAKTAVTQPFVDHLTQSNNYAKAVKAGDKDAEATALAALRVNIRQVADVFHSVIPSLSSDTLYQALDQHEELMNQVAAAYQAGDYQKAYQLEDQALTQISGGADALAKGIVASKPDSF